MLSIAELTSIARARLKDAAVLLNSDRYDGAVYLCGYAVEVALKARIAKTLRWTHFPADGGEFKDLASLKTHNLQLLVRLCGREAKIKAKLPAEWSVVSQWTSESRYKPPGKVPRIEAESMLESAKKVVKALL